MPSVFRQDSLILRWHRPTSEWNTFQSVTFHWITEEPDPPQTPFPAPDDPLCSALRNKRQRTDLKENLFQTAYLLARCLWPPTEMEVFTANTVCYGISALGDITRRRLKWVLREGGGSRHSFQLGVHQSGEETRSSGHILRV